MRRALLSVATAAATLGAVLAGAPAGAAQEPPPLTATALAPDGPTVEAPKSRSARIARSDEALLARTDDEIVSVLVKYDVDPVASYAGGVAGLEATSPETTGRSVKQNRGAVERYTRHLAREHGRVAAALERRVPAADVGRAFTTVYGGAAVRLPASQADELLDVPGVVAVQADRREQLLTDASPAFVRADAVWPALGGSSRAGEGVVVGVLDSGIWPEHPSLSDPGTTRPAGTFACDFGDGRPGLGAPFACNDKLVGAHVFLDTALALGGAAPGEYCVGTTCSARDADGHGTHTATTAAGAPVASATLLGVERGPVSGIAPGAHVIAYRVCLDAGCYTSDSVAAVEQAVEDGVDVINFSISGGASAYTDAVELAFLDAYAAGVSVHASAGNDGPGAGTANHAGPWVTTVAASTSNRAFATTLRLTAADGSTYAARGSTVTSGVPAGTPLVRPTDVPGYSGGALCLTPFAAGSLAGRAVACERGQNDRVAKSQNAAAGGALGMVLYNVAPLGTNTDSHSIPTVHLEAPAAGLVAFLARPGVTAAWDAGQATAVRGDVMAGFSSRGPVGDVVKPDVTAPGLQVLAGHTPTPLTGVRGELFQAIAGTSMASPHAAGIAALVRAAHPTWTPGQVKSALMTSSLQDVLKEDGTTAADPFDRGAGSVRADRAVSPTVTLDVTARQYAASAALPASRLDLNLPSIRATTAGATSTTRTVRNVTDRAQTLRATVSAPDGVRIAVTPALVTLQPGQSRTLGIALDATAAPEGLHFGGITLTSQRGGPVPVHLPVALTKQQGALQLAHTCAPQAVPAGSAAACTATVTSTVTVAADVDLTVTGAPQVALDGDAASGPRTTPSWRGTLAPTSPPTVTAIEPGATPAGGYVPLSTFGIPAAAGVGDETITNFPVPAFRWGGETYTRVGVVSNGYLVMGGGSADDVTYEPQSLPDTAAPNDVVAPYWTDLDPSSGGAVRAGVLTDGVTSWAVVDWDRVSTFGSAAVSSFQVWIRLGTKEEVTMAHGGLGAPSADGLTVGAEDRTGTSGAQLSGPPTAPAYVVRTAPSRAGGSATLAYTATPRLAGAFDLVATARSSSVRGTTTAVTRLTATR